ncbi:tripartite tricarboxylate transporter TctB family protein [Brevibacillus sp. H7]|jgi:putative tricarboxylic transport membrane protein|uniref:tripartite tricarboxylate transporter TctB family protein n=1 Tax=Brevibacillus sp. H7 TaxID=3349138 RepID=UPI00381A46CF
MNKTFDRYASAIFALIGALFVAESRNIAASAYGSQVGPNLFPLGLGILLILLSVRLFYETAKVQSDQSQSVPLRHKRFLLMLAVTFLYAWFLEEIGYLIGTFLFLLAGFKLMGSGSWLKSAGISLLFSSGVYYTYVHILKGTLPGFPSWLGF